jgi:CheY-like chemotaxis protein/anti-sigma regulatory factor (Ser/Thr protein kinase)
MTFGRGGAPVRRTASLEVLVRDAVELARAGANVRVEVEIADGLWPAEVDAAQVSHALQNILINARQAMPEGGAIEVRAENVALKAGVLPLDAGNYVRISVHDHGCGIAAAHLPRIFEPYFTTKPTGTGLGLAAAYSIARKHDGHITVESTPGAGTTFAMYLPAAAESVVAEQRAAEAVERGSGRILVMDDEEALRSVLSRILTRLGYAVASARDGGEAIAMCENERTMGRRFDAALLDLTVPGGMGGVAAAARLKQIDPSMALIATSGYSESAVMSACREYGFDEAIPKPWTAGQVSEVLKRVLAKRRRDARGM